MGQDVITRNRENKVVLALVLLAIYLVGDKDVFEIFYLVAAVCMILRTLYAGFRKREKTMLCFTYVAVFVLQVTYIEVAFGISESRPVLRWILNFLGVLAIALPLFTERFITANKNARFYLPSLEEVESISFSEIRENAEKVRIALNQLKDTAGKLTPENLEKALITDSHGHSSVSYVNQGSLTEDFFQAAKASLTDPYLYLVISDTGSAASEIISSVTRKTYNHASPAFDRQLRTTLSYNGGANIYPPGLNPEMVAHFHQKSDASVLVYRLYAGTEKKNEILSAVERINREGSAYNMLGLVTKWSYKPNIMFCSQFVYRMLQTAGLEYFSKRPEEVRPTDFIELDYRRVLEFVEEITF